MRMSWKIGRVAGIDVFLHPTFLILLAFVGLSGGSGFHGVALTTAAFGCVLLHELGHALMARQFGIATEDITLYPIGGVARLRRLPKAPGAELLIALAGPAVNFAILAVLSLLPGGYFVNNLFNANVMLALFNLIPAFPMDGGRVLRALLTVPIGRLRATEVAATLGQALAVAFPVIMLGLGAFSLMHVFLAGFLYLAAGSELQQIRAEFRGRDEDDDHGIWNTPPGYRWVNRGHGTWQLAPIVVVNPSRDPRWRG